MRFDRGSIALVLDAHTPFVSSARSEATAPLRDFFAEITQTYLPLLSCLDELARQEVRYHLTISFSPTLLQMIGEPGYQVAYDRYLDEQLAADPPTARRVRIEEAARLWREVYQGRLAGGFASLQRSGHLELLATSATRACLPLLAATPGALEAQIRNGVIEYQRLFSATPSGFWLPETAYAPGLDDLLLAEGLQYTFVEQATLSAADDPSPLSVRCPSGLRVYGLNSTLAGRIADNASAYPATPVFFNAAGRTTPYDGGRARWVASEQAREFAEALQAEVVKHGHLSREPVICCALPATILGTTWLEGIDWLAALLRATAGPASDILSHPLGTAAPGTRGKNCLSRNGSPIGHRDAERLDPPRKRLDLPRAPPRGAASGPGFGRRHPPPRTRTESADAGRPRTISRPTTGSGGRNRRRGPPRQPTFPFAPHRVPPTRRAS